MAVVPRMRGMGTSSGGCHVPRARPSRLLELLDFCEPDKRRCGKRCGASLERSIGQMENVDDRLGRGCTV